MHSAPPFSVTPPSLAALSIAYLFLRLGRFDFFACSVHVAITIQHTRFSFRTMYHLTYNNSTSNIDRLLVRSLVLPSTALGLACWVVCYPPDALADMSITL